jgi:DNA-binding CsgD family transcriptional regulator
MSPSTTVIRLSDFVSRRELHKTAIYNDLYRSLGVEYQVVVPISFGAPSSDGVRTKRAESLTLARWDSDFTDRERTLLDEFGRHVRNTARRLRSLGTVVTIASAEQFGLTTRQSESLIAIAEGASVRKAAESLGVTPKTLENHLQAAYGRLGVSNRTAALARLRAAEPANFGLGEIPY